MDQRPTRDLSHFDPDLSTHFDLVRQFVDHLFAREGDSTFALESPENPRPALDWRAIDEAAAGSQNLEQAVGRSVLVADQMSRGVYQGRRLEQPDAKNTGTTRWATHSGAAFGHVLKTHKGASSLLCAIALLLITLSVAVASGLHGPTPSPTNTPASHGIGGNAQLLRNAAPASLTGLPVTTTTVAPSLPAATTPPAAAPPSLADAPPLRPHEVFGFAPYWTLPQSAGFDLSRISTVAYFSIGVNADGSLDQSGPGWNGYLSQAFVNLVTRAHDAGDRVVLTVNDFSQASLDQLTSSPTAPQTLAQAIIGALRAKNLDGVNFDFEGQGSNDQAGLTNLVTQASSALHQANPNYQVTMDTYASSAGDSSGFYNISALAPAVDGFFVMAYQLNLQSSASSVSPLTSTMFSEKTAVEQYVAAAPASKVILGMPYFGIDWPTSDGTLTATATGPASTVTYGQVVGSGHPIYWDATTDTAWTSYEIGSQWHESFFEAPASLYDAAELANSFGLAGVGIWALGMDGNDPNMTAALAGLSSAVKDYPGGPTSTSTSSTSSTTTTTTTGPDGSTTTTSSSTIPSTSAADPSAPASTFVATLQSLLGLPASRETSTTQSSNP